MYVIAACFLSYQPLVSRAASSEGNSWAKSNPQHTNQSNSEDDWVQLVHKKGQNGGTVTEGSESTIRVDHELTVHSDVRKQWDSDIVQRLD
ncbi:hypothetical protein N7488_009177 [Penicillium malachiteum]|nr:hypothetical protein N7488_009177 [Penicillium malachiteum]